MARLIGDTVRTPKAGPWNLTTGSDNTQHLVSRPALTEKDDYAKIGPFQT